MLPSTVTVVLTVALALAQSGGVSSQSRITKATTVRLRAEPATTATAIAELPLGTELVALDDPSHDASWLHVRTGDGRTGWVLGSLTAAFDPLRREEAIEAIVVDRLSIVSEPVNAPFATHTELFNLVEQTTNRLTGDGARARFALYRLQSMKNLLAGIPFGGGERDPYRAWIRDHQGAAQYSEPGGIWIVDPRYVLQIHERYRGSAAADDIAWFFVQNGLAGECEGDIPCYITGQNTLNGEYLRLHAGGRHADESTADIARTLNDVMDNLRIFPAVLGDFDPKSRCVELHRSLDPLQAAVSASTSAHKADAMAAIDRFAQLCK
jgi:hypothetical protein